MGVSNIGGGGGGASPGLLGGGFNYGGVPGAMVAQAVSPMMPTTSPGLTNEVKKKKKNHKDHKGSGDGSSKDKLG